MWFNSEIEPLNAEFIYAFSFILFKMFSWLLVQPVQFSKNVWRGFHLYLFC